MFHFILLDIYRPQRGCGKVMFLHVSVILFTGGRQVPVRETSPDRAPPPDTAPLDRDSPLGQIPPDREPPRQRTLPDRDPLWTETPWTETLPRTVTSGRYASYWNAFLLGNIFLYPTVKIKQGHMTLIHCDFLAHLPIVFNFCEDFPEESRWSFSSWNRMFYFYWSS